jgi:hypothetical protein
VTLVIVVKMIPYSFKVHVHNELIGYIFSPQKGSQSIILSLFVVNYIVKENNNLSVFHFLLL